MLACSLCFHFNVRRVRNTGGKKTDTVFSIYVKPLVRSPGSQVALPEPHECNNQLWLKELEALENLKKQRKV